MHENASCLHKKNHLVRVFFIAKSSVTANHTFMSACPTAVYM